jgi:hypothetical protein
MAKLGAPFVAQQASSDSTARVAVRAAKTFSRPENPAVVEQQTDSIFFRNCSEV